MILLISMTHVKNVTHVDTSRFALKTNLATLKTKVDKLDIDKLVPVLSDFSKLSHVVNELTKHTITLKLQKLKINLIIIILTNILMLNSLIN